MPTSGTYNFTSLVREVFDEAFERAGVDLIAVGTYHLKGAFRSLRMMLNSEWSTIGIRQWQIAEAQVHTVAVGEVSFLLPLGQLDITEAVLRRQGAGVTPADVEMYPITRDEYTMITNKQIQGRPDRYFVDRQFGQKVVYYWQAGSNTTDQIIFNAFHQNQDVADNMVANLDIPTYAYEALCAGLAAKFALKWNQQRFEMLQALYAGPQWAQNPLNPGGALGALRAEDRERGDLTTYPAFEPRTGRR
jgi:hypothetical protein